MVTLESYIRQHISSIDDSIYLEYGSGIYLNDIKHITSNIQLEPIEISRRIPIPPILVSKSSCCYHHELIDILLEYIIDKKINNVLKIGYTDGSSNNTSDQYVFRGFNTTIIMLKSKPMEIIREIIGIENFIDIILNYNAVWKANDILMWGEFKTKEFNEYIQKPSIHCRSMLYAQSRRLNKMNPVIENPWELLKFVFSNDLPKERKKNDPPKRFRKVFKLIKKLVHNHRLHMREYPYMLDDICAQPKGKLNENFSLCIEKKNVIRFAMSVIYKVIPVEFFGSARNRTKIMRTLPKMINGTIYEKFPISNFMKNVKLNDVLWLKPRDNCKMTKIEFLRAKNLFGCFLSWLFRIFTCKLIASFFHVTEASQKDRLLFFRHHIWDRISKKYMSKYFADHLIKKEDYLNGFKSFSKNTNILGNMYLVPKKNSFRIIVKPFKGNKSEKIEYLTHQKRTLRPLLQILQTIRSKNSCGSVNEIIRKIYDYKKYILNKYDDKLPQIYSYKFDVQNAYDSIPHDIIDKVVKERLDFFTNNEFIYVHFFQETDKNGYLSRQKKVVITSIAELPLMSHSSKARPSKIGANMVDKNETLTFSKSEILNFVRKQYENTCFHTRSKSYFRSVGVYQGFSFSGLLFNIVYDSVVDELKDLIDYNDETVILRLMDDFIVLSTDKKYINRIKKITARSIKKYNLKINRTKTEFSTDTVSFVGLNISIKSLTCHKLLNDYNNSPLHVSSFDKLYNILHRYFEIRTKYIDLFNHSIYKSGVQGCQRNVNALLKSVLYKFSNSYKLVKMNDTFKIANFYQFVNILISNLSAKVPLDVINFDPQIFWSTSLKILRQKNILQVNNR